MGAVTRAVRLAALAGLLALPGCAGTVQGPPPGSVERVRFQTVDGRPATILRSGTADLYYLYLPGASWAAQRLPALDGLSGLAEAGTAALGPETILLLRGAEPGCPDRYELLAVQAPRVWSAAFPRCGGGFRLLPPRHRQAAVVIYGARSRPPQYFSYAGGQLYGPTAHAAAGPRAAPRGHGAAQRAAAPSAVNLDDLPDSPSSPAVNPDK